MEYGSSFGAIRPAGTTPVVPRRGLQHERAAPLARRGDRLRVARGRRPRDRGAVNIICYRGTTRHVPIVPGLVRPAFGPRRFFYYNLFESDVTGAPLAIRTRARGSVDEYAGVVGRWLVTRDGFDFLVFYLPDYDFASHALGPEAAHAALAPGRQRDRLAARGRRRPGRVPRALRGRPLLGPRPDRRRQLGSPGGRLLRIQALPPGNGRGAELVVTASNRAGMVYRLPRCTADARELAQRLHGSGRRRSLPRGRQSRRPARRGGAALRSGRRGEWVTSGTTISSRSRTRSNEHGPRSGTRTRAT